MMLTLKDNFKTYFLDYLKLTMKRDWLLWTSPFRPNYIEQRRELEKEDPFNINRNSQNKLSFFFSFLATMVNLCLFVTLLCLLRPFRLDLFLIVWIVGSVILSAVRFYRHNKKKEQELGVQ